MGRAPRCDFADAIHLVTNRGTARTMIFRSDADRRSFLSLLGDLEGRFGVEVIAFVLMGNHFHLIVRSRSGLLSRALHHLEGSFSRGFNPRHDRRGALFQGRFDSRLIEDDVQLHRAGAYVHLNPVKAGLVTEALQHRWSSLRSYASGRRLASWLHLDLLQGRSPQRYLDDLTALTPAVLAIDDDRFVDHELQRRLFGSVLVSQQFEIAPTNRLPYMHSPSRIFDVKSVSLRRSGATSASTLCAIHDNGALGPGSVLAAL